MQYLPPPLIQRSSVILASEYPRGTSGEATMLCLQWFVCLGVIVALSILGGWNMFLISIGVNTIEFYTNKRDAREMKKEGRVCSVLHEHITIFLHVYMYSTQLTSN